MTVHARRRGGSAGGVRSLTLAATSVSNASTITIPAGAQAGDLAVMADHGYLSGDTPTDVVPTGWTGWSGSNIVADLGFDAYAGRMSYKILVGGDPGASITGMNLDSEEKVMLVFRGDRAIETVTASTASKELTTGNPTSQTVSAAGQATPLVIIGVVACHFGTADFSTASPAFDASVAAADGDMRIGYKIYNASPVSHTIDAIDIGDDTYLATGWISVE